LVLQGHICQCFLSLEHWQFKFQIKALYDISKVKVLHNDE
jgi:hypothetical protein